MPSRPKGDESVNAGHPTSTRIVIAWVAVVGWAVVAAWLLGRGLAPDLSPVAPVESVLGGERLDQARDFRGSIRLVGLLSQIAVLLALAAMALYRGFPPAGTIERLKAWPVAGGVVLGALVAVVLFLVRLPFAFAGWQVGTDYGLLTLGLGTWLLDGLKGLLISIVLFGLAGGAATWAWARFERRFWLVASAGLGVFAVVWVWVWPVVVAPLFNRVEPLAPGPARTELERIAGRAGVEVEGVFTEDASRRTRAVNAYVHGLGPSRRIVIRDTALDRLGPGETAAIVAHEIAHVEYRDPERGLLFALLVIPPAALAVQLLAAALLRRRGAGAATPLVVLPLALGAALASLSLSVPGSWLSRQVEIRADQRSLELTGDPASTISLHRTLARTNLQDPSPPALWTGLFGTHPTAVERVGLARQFGDGGGEGPG
jgi:STE24 endopeptidase